MGNLAGRCGLMHAVTVSFGRNVGSAPMPATDWRRFRAMVRRALVDACPDAVLETHHGVGVWDGVREQSCKVTALAGDLGPAALLRLSESLAGLASAFRQDAIAVTVGRSELVMP